MTKQILDIYAGLFKGLQGEDKEWFLQALANHPGAVIDAINATLPHIVMSIMGRPRKYGVITAFPGHEGMEILQHLHQEFLGKWWENPPPLPPQRV